MAEDDAVPDDGDDGTLSLAEAVAAYRQNIPMLHLMVAKVRHEVAQAMEQEQDLRLRRAMQQQMLLWDVNSAVLGSLPMILQMLSEVYSAMGCTMDGPRKVH